jgi:hypothetical protein
MAKGIQQRYHQPFLRRKLAIPFVTLLNENTPLDSLG